MFLPRTYRSKTNTIISSAIRLYSSKIETVDNAYTIYDTKNDTTKPPLLIFHALMGARCQWSAIAKTINELTGRKVITMDTRNHGESPTAPDMTYMHMAHDAIELLKRLGLQKVSLLGHSMGGRTAMVLALIRSDLISSLFIEDMSPSTNHLNTDFVLSVLGTLNSVNFNHDKDMSDMRALAHEKLKAINADKKLRDFMIENLVQKDGRFSWKPNIPVLMDKFISQIYVTLTEFEGIQYCGPTLFVGGAQSKHLPKEDIPGIRKLFPKANVTYIEGASHWIHLERPEEFMRTLCKFLEDH